MAHLEAGMRAPDFEAKDTEGTIWRLSDLRGKKVILYFYPADDTPGCTREACDFRDSYADLQGAGYVLLGASPQGAESKYDLNFPLLVDEDTSLARAYGVIGDYGDYKGIALQVKRSTFVIDEDGVIEQALYGVNARGHVGELRATIAV